MKHGPTGRDRLALYVRLAHPSLDGIHVRSVCGISRAHWHEHMDVSVGCHEILLHLNGGPGYGCIGAGCYTRQRDLMHCLLREVLA